MGYSIVQIDEQNNIVCSHRGKLKKWFSSTQAELAACLIAVLIAPNEGVVEIRTDSLYAIVAISESLKNESTRRWLKVKNNSILQAIVKACKSKKVWLELIKVKAYSGDIYNDIVDQLAKEGAKGSSLLEINNISIKNIKFLPE